MNGETRAQPRSGFVALGLLGLAVAMTWPMARVWRPELPYWPDASFNAWRLAWVAHQLRTDPAHLFDANIFFPAAHSLAFSDAMLLLGFMAAPLIWAGVHVFVVHNLLVVAAFWSASYGTYRLCLRIASDRWGAVIGGIVAGYAPYRFGHIAHLELLWTAFLPVGLAALLSIFERPSFKASAALAGAVVAQTLCSIYYGIYFVIYLAFAAAGLTFRRQRAALSRVGPAIAMAGAMAGLALAPYVMEYRAARTLVAERTREEILQFSAVPDDYLRVSSEQALPLPQSAHAEERSLYPGIVALTLAIVGLAVTPGRAALHASLLIVSVDLSMGLNGLVYPVLLDALPALASLRAPARFGALVLLSLSVLAALGAARIVSFRQGRRYLAVALAAIMLVEYLAAPLVTRPEPTSAPPLQAWLSQQPRGVVVELPLPVPEALWGREIDYQLMSIYHWHPMVNGYSGNAPREYVGFLDRMRTFPDQNSLDALRAKHVRWIVIHQALYEPAPFVEVIERVLASPGLRSVGTYADQWGQAIVLELPSTTS